MKKDRSLTNRTIATFWQYTRRYPRHFYIGAGGAALAVIMQNIVPPFIVSRTFSKLQTSYVKHQTLHFSMFRSYFIIYTIAMILGAVLWRVQSFMTWGLEENVARDIANESYDHLQSQSQRFHADRFAGALVSQSSKFKGAYERLMDDFIWSIVPGLTTLLSAVFVLLFVAPWYALGLIILSSLYVAVMAGRVSRQMPYNVASAQRESEQTAALADSLTNMGTIRAFGHEKYESKRFKAVTQRVFDAYHALSIEVLKTEAVSHVQTNGFQVVAFLGGLFAVTHFNTNVSLLYLLLSYTQAITGQLQQFSKLVRNLNRSLGDSAEMTDILAIRSEVQDPKRIKKAEFNRGAVEFNDVTFFYPENHVDPLFQNLSFRIKPGEKVGLVGPSGGGKTTITKLLLRFMDIQEGQISIDGLSISGVAQQTLRSRIAYVSQEPILFHRSLADNIRYGNLDASQQTVEAVAKLANAHDFIQQLPHKYDTFVGERGVKLSGGQRQRVAIARAMLKSAPIIVLDEATSALDSESEVLIQDALWKLMEGRTAIVIAHRLSTIQKMDRIIVLDNGAIAEQGSHKELLHAHGTYAKLWAHQSGGFMEDE